MNMIANQAQQTDIHQRELDVSVPSIIRQLPKSNAPFRRPRLIRSQESDLQVVDERDLVVETETAGNELPDDCLGTFFIIPKQDPKQATPEPEYPTFTPSAPRRMNSLPLSGSKPGIMLRSDSATCIRLSDLAGMLIPPKIVNNNKRVITRRHESSPVA
jgi:hypothetical protein